MQVEKVHVYKRCMSLAEGKYGDKIIFDFNITKL